MTDMMSVFAPRETAASASPHDDRTAQAATSALAAQGAWGEFMRKVLSPVGPSHDMRLIRAARA
jgi:hypothetical protein